MTLRDWAIVAVCAVAVSLNACWRAAVWFGALPCNHHCYWCGKPLEGRK